MPRKMGKGREEEGGAAEGGDVEERPCYSVVGFEYDLRHWTDTICVSPI